MGVSLKKISGTAEEVGYVWEEIEQGRARDEYLREHGGSNVTWIGAAHERGFGGEPTQDDAQLLLNGRAADGERLLRKAEVQGYDLTFSMPKDVSVTYAVSGREVRRKLDHAFNRAFELTMEKFEQHLLFVRIGSGRREAEREVVPATGVVGIRYEHSYSREGDPQVHYHAMISSVVEDPHGDLRRMWVRDMGELCRTLGYWHEAFLREEISKQLPGLEWEPVQENGTAHLARFPASLRDVMSTRSRKIKQEVDEWEKATGREANSAVKQMITLKTRPRKPDAPDHAQWTAKIVAIAEEHGFTQEFVREILNSPRAAPQEIPIPGELADRLLGAGGLTATRTTFRKTDVIVAVIQAGVAGSQVEEYADAILADSRVIAIETLKGVTYVTEDLVQAERAIERMVLEGIDAVPHLAVNHDAAVAAIESVDFELTAGQREVVIAAATSPDRMVPVEAGAGTGKTTAAGVIRAALESRGISVRGAAPTGKAAVELEADSGIPTRTIHSLKWEVDRGGSLSEGRYQVLCVDEGGMADTRVFAWVLEQAEREGMKVIVFGDSNQLTSVAPGGWLGYLSRAGIRPALRMDQIIRQRDPEHRKAVSDLSRGRPGTWIDYQTDHGNVIHLGAGQEHQYGARAAEMLVDAGGRHGWDRVLAITPTNMRRELINELVQQARLAGGELGEALAESSEHELFHVGDRVMFIDRNDRRSNLQNGLIGTVVGKTERELVIAINQQQIRKLRAEHVAENLRLAYAVTDYKAQGVTVEETVMVAAPEELSLNRGYVAASRARELTRLVLISDRGAEQALKDLDRHLRMRDDDELAIEHIDNVVRRSSARGPAPNQWLSGHRSRIEELGRELEQLAPAWAGTSKHDDRIAEIEDRQRRIRAEDGRDYGLMRKPGRKHREQERDVELQHLEKEKKLVRAEAAEIDARVSQRWDEWQRITDERQKLIAAAAKDEIELRIDGERAPWVYEALGPEPPAEQEGLAQRWSQVAEHLARWRIDHDLTEPTDTGITNWDAMLVKEIHTLSRESARGLGIGD
jgi:conjugative relaxase-like TrwC/TraI family protein